MNLQRAAELHARHRFVYTVQPILVLVNLALIPVNIHHRIWWGVTLNLTSAALLTFTTLALLRSDLNLERQRTERHRAHKQRFPGVFDLEDPR
jgi:hypothetical protein